MKPKVRVCAARGCDEALSWRVSSKTILCPQCRIAGVTVKPRGGRPAGYSALRHDDVIDTLLEVLAGP